MTSFSIPRMYPEAQTQIQSHLFALANLAAKELEGVRVPGVSPHACSPRHKAVAILDHLTTRIDEPPIPRTLKDQLADVFVNTSLTPRSDMDYLLALHGLALLTPKRDTHLPQEELISLTNTFIQKGNLQNIELGIFVGPMHQRVCNFLISHQRNVSENISTQIEFALRAYLELWPHVPRTAPEAPLHPVFYAIAEKDLQAIRNSTCLQALQPPKGW